MSLSMLVGGLYGALAACAIGTVWAVVSELAEAWRNAQEQRGQDEWVDWFMDQPPEVQLAASQRLIDDLRASRSPGSHPQGSGSRPSPPITTQQCNGKTCTTVTTGYIPITTHHGECYQIKYRAGDDTSKVCVSEHEYENLEIGSHYVRSSS